MSGCPCFYLPPESWGNTVFLDSDESNHLSVLRVPVGATVQLIDGQGRLGHFTVEEKQKKQVRLTAIDSQTEPRPANAPILALALSKAVRRGFFMEKAVELGAFAIWLWQGERSQGKIHQDLELSLKRQMIAGAKQCKNPWIPTIACFPKGLPELLAGIDNIPNRILPWELEETSAMLSPAKLKRDGQTLYVIGPEGGFSESELNLLDCAHFERVSLGSRILRCETAATLCLGLHWWARHCVNEGVL